MCEYSSQGPGQVITKDFIDDFITYDFWVLAPCSLVEVHGRIRGLRASIIRLPDYTALQTSRQPSSDSSPREH